MWKIVAIISICFIGFALAAQPIPLESFTNFVTNLPTVSTVNSFDTTYLLQGGRSKKVTIAQLAIGAAAVDYINVSAQPGVDCSAITDSTTGLQNAINAMPDGATLFWPLNCKLMISSTISIASRANVHFISNYHGGKGGCEGEAPGIIWNASGGIAWDLEWDDSPYISGLNFTVNSGKYVGAFLNFDRNPAIPNPNSKTGTAGRVYDSCFNNGISTNGGSTLISISAITTENEENFELNNLNLVCSNSHASKRSALGIINSTTLVAASDGNFTSADVGQTIWLTYPGYFQQTTIASVQSTTQVTLAATATASKSNVTIHVGQSYGTGIFVGPSFNALQESFSHINTSACDKGISVYNGQVWIDDLDGGGGDWGIYLNGVAGFASTIAHYASENDLRGIEVVNASAPVLITGARLSNANQFADGFFKFGGLITLEGSTNFVSPPSNGVLIGFGSGGSFITSIGNNWNSLTTAQVGYATGAAVQPEGLVVFNDNLSQANSQSQNIVQCFSNSAGIGNTPTTCMTITNNWGHQPSTALFVQSVSAFLDTGYASTDVQANGSMTLTKRSGADTVAPGAGSLRFEAVAGTNAGSCKIIAYAGTSATATTVIDNIGSGC